ncbi:MAG: hypothetical protein IJX52_07990 [Oscillibacter sp.]|nr:hypothetical protein [Oscillibacter sp.]
MRTKERFSPPVVGGSSLLVIFAVLCLTVFALLGLSTVQADRRLSDASAQAVRAYYEADVQAETILAQLREGRMPEGVAVNGEFYAYVCPISDTQELQVQLRRNGENWEILSWKAVSIAVWETDDSLSVWDGDPIF